MFIGIKLQYSFNIIPILTYSSYQFWATIMFASSVVTGERWCLGFSCGRTTYVAGIWFGQLFKMISFELFAFVFFKYFSFGLSRTFLRVDSLFQIGVWIVYFYLYCSQGERGRE